MFTDENIKVMLITMICLVGMPVYLYGVVRWLSLAIFRSFFEIKSIFEEESNES